MFIFLSENTIVVPQSCLTFCNPMDCSPPGFSVHGILQSRIIVWVAISLLQRIFLTQGLNPGLLHGRQILYGLSHQGSQLSLYVRFILSTWIKSFLFELNFRKCNKAWSWWNVKTKLEFVFEIGMFCLLSSLLNNLNHIAALNIVFFKTRFSQCKWEKSVMFLILKTLFPRPFMLEQMIFISHFSPLGSGHRCILCFI